MISISAAAPAVSHPVQRIVSQISKVILGKERQVRLALACILARGHLLIEDIPGVGKTTLAHALARSLGLEFQRIQFTSDMLPADILGVSIFDREASKFKFHPGPIFSHVLLDYTGAWNEFPGNYFTFKTEEKENMVESNAIFEMRKFSIHYGDFTAVRKTNNEGEEVCPSCCRKPSRERQEMDFSDRNYGG